IDGQIEDLKDNVFYYIKSMEENTVEASKFYILFIDYLENMIDSLENITRSSYNHVNNNHKHLKFNQIRDLKVLDQEMGFLFDDIIQTFETHNFGDLDKIIDEKTYLTEDVSELIQKQIRRIR